MNVRNNESDILPRLIWIFGGFSVFIGLILYQMYKWQIVYHERYKTFAANLTSAKETLVSRRGAIYSSDGTVLSIDEPVWFLYFSVGNSSYDQENFAETKETVLLTISDTLGLSYDDLLEEVELNPNYYPIKHFVDDTTKRALEEQSLFGLHFEKEYKRVYPNGKLAANVLGYVKKNGDGEDEGQYGVTQFYWGALSGTKGYLLSERDVYGNIILKADYNPVQPRDGKDIVLTIDSTVQRLVEDELKNGVIETGSKSGVAIVMDPKTGKVIAMASYPTYDPNRYWEVKDTGFFRNRSVSDAYEYGSVNKPLTISMALELGLVEKDYICYDNYGYMEIFDKKIYTWDKRSDGALTLAGILQNSNNVCAAQVGMLLTPEQYYNFLVEFGIGVKPGIGLSDEASGLYPHYSEWTKLDVATASFGQMITATPIEIISAISAIANDGKRMQPYIVEKIIGPDETLIVEPRIVSTPISEETADLVSEMMTTVVTEGDARYYLSEFSEYKIAGKTGTAQIARIDAPGYEENKTNVTFVGFAPYDNPQFIMLVKLEEPTTSTLSANTVVPVWANIFRIIKDEVVEL